VSGALPTALGDFSALGRVTIISLVLGAGIVSVFSFGLVGAARWLKTRASLGLAAAAACFAISIAAVAAGLLLIIRHP
jgi:hypothetical protein